MKLITRERLKELVEYDPITGIFRSKTKRGKIRCGGIVGSHNPKGYLQIGLDYRFYIGHRLAWLYMTGKWPKEDIDHIDGDPRNNRFNNLREATRAQNCHNRRKAKGIYRVGKRWRAGIVIGKFDTEQEAKDAYLKVKRQLREFFIT